MATNPNNQPLGVEVQSAYEAATGIPTGPPPEQSSKPQLNPENLDKSLNQPAVAEGKASGAGFGVGSSTAPKLDYFGLKLSGMKDDDIFQQAAYKGAVVNVRDKETIWNGYANEAYKGNRELFESQYSSVVNDYEGYKKLDFDTYAPTVTDFDLIDRRPIQTQFSLKDKPQNYKSAYNLEGAEKLPDGYTTDSHGYWHKVKSDEQMADTNGMLVGDKLYDISTQEGYGKALLAYNKETYGDYDIGKTIMSSPLTLDQLFFGAKPDREIPNLVLDYSSDGNPFWKPVSNYERIKSSQLRSVWGPRNLYNSTVGDFLGSAVNSFFTNVPSIFGSAVETVGGFVNIASPDSVVGNYLIDRGNYMENTSSRAYFNESESQQRGTEGTIAREVGGAVGMILQAAVSGGAALEIQGGKAVTNAAVMALRSQKAASMNRVFFAATMADGFNQGSKEAGVSQDRAALTYGVSFLTSWYLIGKGEKLFGLNAGSPHGVGLAWKPVLGDMEAMSVVKRESQEVIKNNLAKLAELLGKPVSELPASAVKQAENASRLTMLGRITAFPKKALGAVTDSGKPILSHMVTAGTEMSGMHIANNAIMMASDYVGSSDNLEGEEGQYNVEGLTHGVGHAFLTGLAMGAFSGGMQKFQEYRDPQIKTQNRTSMDYIMTGRQEQLYKSHEKLKNQSWYGSDTIEAATGRTVEKGAINPATGEKYVTLNDVGYESAIRGLKAVEDVYETSGIKEWHQSAKGDTKNPNAKYMKDAFDRQFSDTLKEVITPDMLAKDVMEKLLEKKGIENELSQEGISDAEKAKLQKELEKIDSKTKDFLDTIQESKKVGKRIYSQMEGRVIRDGLVKSRYLYDSDRKAYTPESLFRVGLGNTPIQVTSAKVDLFNETAKNVLDSTKINEMRAANNEQTATLFGEMSKIGGVNAEVLKKVQDLHANHLLTGIAPGERQAVENLASQMSLNSQKDYADIINELSSKYGIELGEEQSENLADNFDLSGILGDVYSRAVKKDSTVAQGYESKVSLLRDFEALVEKIETDKKGMYSKGERTPADILKEVYTSINGGTAEEPQFVSISALLDNLESSDLSNPADLIKVKQILQSLVESSETLMINNETYNKLKDEVSLLNDSIRISDKDADGQIEGSILSEIEKLFNRAADLRSKIGDVSAEARKAFDVAFVDNDKNIRNVNVNIITDFITKEYHSSKDIQDATISVRSDLSKIETIEASRKQTHERYDELAKKSTTSALSESEKEELKKIEKEDHARTYEMFSYVLSAEHKLHQIFNSKDGETIFNKVQESLEVEVFKTKEKGGEIIVGMSNMDFSVIDQKTGKTSYYNSTEYLKSLYNTDSFKRVYAYNHFMAHLNNIKRVSSRTFYDTYNQYISKLQSEDPSFLAPTFEQQRVIHHAVAFLVDPTLIAAKRLTGSDPGSLSNEGMLAVLGFAGTGKTKITMPFIIDLYSQVKGVMDKEAGVVYKQPVYILTAPHVKQRENMRSVETNTKSDHVSIHDLDAVLEQKIDALKSESDVVIIIDESSELNDAHITQLRKLRADTGVKIIGLSDSGQISGDQLRSYSKFLVGTERSTPITDVHRTGVYDIVRIQETFRNDKIQNGQHYVTYFDSEYTEATDGTAERGLRLRGSEVSAKTEQFTQFMEDLKKPAVGMKTAMVVTNDNQRNSVVSELISKGIDKDLAESSVFALYSEKHTAKGLQFNRTYANIEPSMFEKDRAEYYKAMLTAASRGIDYVDIITEKSSSEVRSSKTDGLATDSAEYQAKSKKAYSEYAASQPPLIQSMLDNITDSSIKTTQKAPVVPKPAPTGLTNKQQAAKSAKQQQNQGNGPSTPKKGRTKKSSNSTYTDVQDGSVTANDGVNVVFGDSVIENNAGFPSYVTGVKSKGKKLFVEVTDTDGSSYIITEKQFRDNYSSFSQKGTIDVEEVIGDMPNGSNRFDTVVKQMHSNSNTGNTRVSTMFGEGDKESSIQKQHFISRINNLVSGGVHTDTYLESRIKKIYLAETEDGFTNAIYNAVDTTAMSEKDMQHYFGTSTPKLVDGKYFVFSMDYHVEGFKSNTPELSNAIQRAALSDLESDWVSEYHAVGGSKKAGRQEDINRDRFIDRVKAYKLASAQKKVNPGQSIELSGASISKITQGHITFATGAKGDKSFEALVKGATMDRGYYAVEMDGKKVYFSAPHLIYDLSNPTISGSMAKAVMYTDPKTGERRFEPGYYVFATFDPSNSSNRVMIKMKSRAYTSPEATALFHDYTNRTNTGNHWSEPAFYDEINRLVNANRYFFENANLQGMFDRKDRVSGIDGRKFTEYRIEVYDINDPTGRKIDVNASFKRIKEVADKIEAAYKSGQNLVMRNFPPGNPQQAQAGRMTFDNAKTLTTNVGNISWPQIVTTEIPLNKSGATGSVKANSTTPRKGSFSIGPVNSVNSFADLNKLIPVDANISKHQRSRDAESNKIAVLEQRFGTKAQGAKIRFAIGTEIFDLSIGSNIISSEYGSKSYLDAAEDVFLKYKKLGSQVKEVSYTTGDGTKITRTAEDLTWQDVIDSNNDPKIKESYINYQLSLEAGSGDTYRRPVYDVVVKSLFDNFVLGTDVETFKLDESITTEGVETLSGTSSMNKNGEKTDPIKSFSSYTKFVISNQPIYEFTVDTKTGKPILTTSESGRNLSVQDMIDVMSKHSADHKLLSRRQEYNFEIIAESIKQSFIEATPKEGVSSETFNKLGSIYYAFFHTSERGQGTVIDRPSYYSIVSEREKVFNESVVHDPLITMDHVNRKAQEASSVLSDVFSSTYSKDQRQHSNTFISRKDGSFNRSSERRNNIASINSSSKKDSTSKLYELGQGGGVLRKSVSEKTESLYYTSYRSKTTGEVSKIENLTKRQIDNLIEEKGGDLVFVNNSGEEIKSPLSQAPIENAGFRATDKGIDVIDSSGTKRPIITKTTNSSGQSSYSFTGTTNGEILNTASSILSFLGMNKQISTGTINAYINEINATVAKNSDTALRLPVTKNSLAEILHAGIDRVINREKYKDLKQEENIAYDEDAAEDAVISQSEAFDSENYDVAIMPFFYREDLAIVENYIRGKVENRFHKGVEGNAVFTTQQGSQLIDMFGGITKEGDRVNLRTAKVFMEDLADTNMRSAAWMPVTDGAGVVLNPWYDRDYPDFDVEGLTLNSGVQKGYTGKKVNRMTPYEMYRDRIDTFVNSLVSVSNDGKIAVPKNKYTARYQMAHPPIGDPGSTYYVSYADRDGRSNPIKITEHNEAQGRKGSAEANWDYFSYSMLKNFELKRRQQALAQDDMINAISSFKRNVSDAATIKELDNFLLNMSNPIERDKLFDSPERLLDVIRKIASPAFTKDGKVDTTIRDLFIKHLEATDGVSKNSHYVLDKYGNVELGSAVKFDFFKVDENTGQKSGDTIYNLKSYLKLKEVLKDHNISDLLALANDTKRLPPEVQELVKSFMKGKINNLMIRFQKELMNNKVRASEKTIPFFNRDGKAAIYKSKHYTAKDFSQLPEDQQASILNKGYVEYFGENGDSMLIHEINPFYEAAWLANMNHAVSLLDVTMGTPFQYKNLNEIAVRAHTMLTPGASYTIKKYGKGVTRFTNVGIYDDSNITVRNSFVEMFSSSSDSKVEAVDGMEVMTGIESVLRRYSLGPNQVKADARHHKEVQTIVNPVTGMKMLIKSSTLDLKALRGHSSFGENQERKMLSAKKFVDPDTGAVITMYDKLFELEMNDEALVDWMFDANGVARKVRTADGQTIDIRKTYISRLAPTSSTKTTGGYRMMDINAEEYDTSNAAELDYQSRRMVLDVNKDERSQRSSTPTQMLNTLNIGEHNFDRTVVIKTALASIAKEGRDQIATLNADSLKSLMIKNSDNIRGGGNRAEIANSKEFSNHLPSMHATAVSAIIKIANDAVKPSFESGAVFVQYPGDAIDMYHAIVSVPELGIVAGDRLDLKSFAKRVKLLESKGIDPNTVFEIDGNTGKIARHGLSGMRAYVKKGDVLVDIESKEYLYDKLTGEQKAVFDSGEMPKLTPEQRNAIISEIESSGGHVDGYEIKIPFTRYKDFLFSDKPSDEFYFKKHDYDDILTIVKDNGDIIRYDRLGDTVEQRMKALAELMGQEESVSDISLDTLALRVLDNAGKFELKEKDGVQYYDKGDIYKLVAEYYEDFISAHDYLINRSPASTSASGFRGKVVGFVHDSSNSIFVTAKKNAIDNSDYDIDELHAISVNTGSNKNTTKVSAQNTIAKTALEYMSDPKNILSLSEPVSVDPLNKLLKTLAELPETRRKIASKFLYDLTSDIATEDMFNQGVETPGIFANGLKAYTNIYHAFSKTKGNHFEPIEFAGKTYTRFFDRTQDGDTGVKIMNTISSLLQAAVDNGKEGLLGKLGANPDTANLIIGLATVGVDPLDIFKIITDRQSELVFKDIAQGRNIDVKNKDIQMVFHSWNAILELSKKTLTEQVQGLSQIDLLNPANEAQIKKALESTFSAVDSLGSTIGLRSRHILKKKVAEVTTESTNEDTASFVEGEETMSSELASSDSKSMLDTIDLEGTINWINQFQGKIKDLQTASILGQRVTQLSKILSINQGIETNNYKRYDYLMTLEELKNPEKFIKYKEKRAGVASIFNRATEVPVISEYESAKIAIDRMEKFLNIDTVIASLPDITEYIQTFQTADRIIMNELLLENPIFREQTSRFLNTVNYSRVYGEESFNTLMTSRSKVLSTMFLEKKGHLYNDISNRYNTKTKSTSGSSNISTPQGQLDFIVSFHELMKTMKERPELFEYTPGSLVDPNTGQLKNSFLSKVEINTKLNLDEYLSIQGLSFITDTESSMGDIAILQNDLKAIKGQTGIDIEQRLFLYNLIVNGGEVKSGSMAQYVDKDMSLEYDKYLSEVHSSLNSKKNASTKNEIQERYKDRLAVFMRENIANAQSKSFAKEDFDLNTTQTQDGYRYEGGIIPRSIEEFPGSATRSIKDFPEYISYNTIISGKIMYPGMKTYKNVFKLMDVEIDRESGDRGMRYVRIDKKISDMLGSWSIDSVAYEGYGNSTIGKTFHALSMNKISELNKGNSVLLRPEEIKSGNYNTGRYYIKTGQIVNVERVPFGSKYGLRVKLENTFAPSLSAPVFKELEIDNVNPIEGVDFTERSEFKNNARNGSEGVIESYENSLKNDFSQTTDKIEVLKLIRDKSLDYNHAVIAGALLNSMSSNKMKIKGKFGMVSLISRPDLVSKINLPAYSGPENINGLYDAQSKNIYLNSDKLTSIGGISKAMLHESVHDISLLEIDKYMNGQPQDRNTEAFAKYMVDLYKHTKTALEARGFKAGDNSQGFYGLENPIEFVSEMLSDNRFKAITSTVPAMNAEVARMGVTNVWQQMMDAIKEFLFKTLKGVVKDNVLEEFMAVSSRYFEGEQVHSLGKRVDISVEATPFGLNMPKEEVEIYSAKLSEREERKAMTPGEARNAYFGFGPVKITKIDNSTNIMDFMVRGAVGDKFNESNLQATYDYVLNTMSHNFATKKSYAKDGKEAKYYIKENGKVYEAKSLDPSEIDRISREIISDKVSYDPKIKKEIISFAKGGSFTELSKGLESSEEFLKNSFNVGPKDNIEILSETDYKNPFFDSNMFDPIVVTSIGSDGNKYVSLTDVTTGSLFKKLTSAPGMSYLADYISKYSPEMIENEQFRLLQTESGMRKFNLLMLGLMMKHKDPNVIFKSMSVMNPVHKESLAMSFPDYMLEMKTLLSDKSLYDILPTEIKEMVDNPKTWERPQINEVTTLQSFYSTEYERYRANGNAAYSAESYSKKSIYGSMLERINGKSNGMNLLRSDILNILKDRAKEIDDYNKGNEGKIVVNPERIALSKAISFLESKGQAPKNKMVDIGVIGEYSRLPYNIMDPVSQKYINNVFTAIETAKNKFVTHQKTIQGLLRNINNDYVKNSLGGIMEKGPQTLFDTGYKRFDRMFVRTKAVDPSTGELLDVNSFEIHYKLGDFIPERSKEALKNGLISKEELELGEYIVNSVKDSFIKQRMLDKETTLDEATKYYNNHWKDGMLPIMSRRASEKIFGKDFVKGIKQYLTKFSRSNELFEYANEVENETGQYVTDFFSGQMGDTDLGSNSRSNKIGLRVNKSEGGRFELDGVTKEEIAESLKRNQSEVEQNIEVLMAYFMMNQFNKQALDKTMVDYYTAQTMLSEYEKRYSDDPTVGGRMKGVRSYLKKFNDLIVKGKRVALSGKDAIVLEGKNGNVALTADDAMRTFTGFAATSMIAGSVLADTKNLMVGALQLQSVAVSNSIAGAENFYGAPDAAKAVSLYTTNLKLAVAISNQYKIAGRDRSAFVNNPRHFITHKPLVSDHWLYIGQFGGDYLIRTLSMLAHMSKKGVLDAHTLDKDGKLVYDETKDQRMYKDGKITEDGKLIKMQLLTKMKEEGLYDGKISLDAKLPMAFDNKLRNSAKMYTDKFIMGGSYDDATKTPLDAYSIGSMFNLFKRYLHDKAQNLYLKGGYSESIGDYVVKDLTLDGETSREVDFQGEYMEGLIQSMMGIYRNAREIGSNKKYHSLTEMWNGQDDIRKVNLTRFAYDSALASAFFMVFPALFGDDDEDSNEYWRSMMDSPIGRSMNYSMVDLMSTYSPVEYFSALKEPFYAITHTGKVANFIAASCKMDVNQMDREAERSIGIYKTAKLIKNTISGDDNSKK